MADQSRRRVEVTRELDVAAVVAFDVVADPRTHARWIPLTRTQPGPGTDRGAFTAVSGPGVRYGVPGFVDRMVAEREVRPEGADPGQVDVRKLGPLLLGTAGFVVRPLGPARCAVTWWEDVHLAGPWPARWTRPVLAPFLRAMMWTSLRRLAADDALRAQA